MRRLFAVLIFSATLFAAARAAEFPSVTVAGMDPPAGVNVPRDTPLYLHLRYRSDQAIRVQAKGFYDGIEVIDGARWNPSPAYPAGSGEAIAWLAFSRQALIDEIRVNVSDARWQPLVNLKVSRRVAWTGMAGAPARAEWVARLSEAQQREAFAGSGEMGGGATGWLVGALVMVGLPGYFVLQILFALRWSGGWRIAALVPLLAMVPAMGHAAFALAAASNLWPIVVILVAPFAFLYLVLVAVAKYLSEMLRPAAA